LKIPHKSPTIIKAVTRNHGDGVKSRRMNNIEVFTVIRVRTIVILLRRHLFRIGSGWIFLSHRNALIAVFVMIYVYHKCIQRSFRPHALLLSHSSTSYKASHPRRGSEQAVMLLCDGTDCWRWPVASCQSLSHQSTDCYSDWHGMNY